MNDSFLGRIISVKQRRVADLERGVDLSKLRAKAEQLRDGARKYRLTHELQRTDRNNVIAEIKRASPSRGIICPDADVTKIAADYEAGGAAGVSVLTEEDHFGGRLEDLSTVRGSCDIPLLRKDFVVSDFQILESAVNGTDAVLLIVAALSRNELRSMLVLARDRLGMDAIVEVHTRDELELAHDIGATVIGINNRNLRTFQTSLDISRDLIKMKLPSVLYISESGISRTEQVEELRGLGFNGFLVGKSLMSAADRREAVRSLSGSGR
jgi:indole-3-glycerol phosphate synthase